MDQMELWTSHWISTVRTVQKPVFCKTALFYPRIVQCRYRLFTGASNDDKRLILLIKSDLSTQ